MHLTKRLANVDASQTPDNHADAHLHVGETLVLGQQRPRQTHQSVGADQADATALRFFSRHQSRQQSSISGTGRAGEGVALNAGEGGQLHGIRGF